MMFSGVTDLNDHTKEQTVQNFKLTTTPSVDCSDSIIYFTMSFRYFPILVFNIVDTEANKPYLDKRVTQD